MRCATCGGTVSWTQEPKIWVSYVFSFWQSGCILQYRQISCFNRLQNMLWGPGSHDERVRILKSYLKPVQVPLFLPPSIGNVHSFCFKVWFPCWIFCIQQNPIVYTYFEPTHPHTHMYIYVCILYNRDMYAFTLYSYSFACHIYA